MNVEKLTWYVARSGGIVAWCLLALSLILGLALSSRVFGKKVSPAWILSVHRYLGGLSVIFTAVHVVAIMLDDFVEFGVTEVLVPWASTWRPGAVAWGIVAMYLMVAIELTSFAMKRLPRRLWRGVHWMSAPLFLTATVHGYQAGSDAGRAFVIATLAVVIVLAALTTVRVIRARHAEERTDPRELLDRAKGKPAMRAERPTSVLAGLTLTSPPPPRPRPARVPDPDPEPERELVGAGAAAGAQLGNGAALTADWSAYACPPSTSLADACPPSTSLADALPNVPDAPVFDDVPVPAPTEPPVFGREDPVRSGPTLFDDGPPAKRPPAQVFADVPLPSDEAEVPVMDDPFVQALADVRATPGASPPAPDNDRRPGPAPGVWKRSTN